VLAQERAKELVVANRAMQSVAAGLRQSPTAAEVENYLTTHPALGNDRRILMVEQIRFAMPGDKALVGALRPAKTMSELTQVLTNRGIAFQRSSAELDSAGLADDVRRQLVATASGEPFIVVEGPTAIASHVVGIRAVDAGTAATTDLAKQRLIADRIGAGVRQREAALRADAKIDYAKDYSPRKSKT
jgi:thymidine phosphorylase